MQEADQDKEKTILTAARTVFHRSGYDGARMQEIADEAGINKALLHYYYRSKDKLFEAVFQEAFIETLSPIIAIMTSEVPLEEKIPLLVDTYVDKLNENPYLPPFVIQELNRSPERILKLATSANVIKASVLIGQIEEGIARGKYRKVDPKHALANLIGMIIFPFVARPLLQFALGLTDEGFAAFLQERKKEIPAAFFRTLANP